MLFVFYSSFYFLILLYSGSLNIPISYDAGSWTESVKGRLPWTSSILFTSGHLNLMMQRCNSADLEKAALQYFHSLEIDLISQRTIDGVAY